MIEQGEYDLCLVVLVSCILEIFEVVIKKLRTGTAMVCGWMVLEHTHSPVATGSVFLMSTAMETMLQARLSVTFLLAIFSPQNIRARSDN